ncbi:MAG: glyoxalase/bleomycin resistance/dioxygenase family protein [Methylocystaceae bacterium]|nr:MAG: glyoxalase/bleomycin resistance/dioxygenase family protein [Methylocystaceae bacterium]
MKRLHVHISVDDLRRSIEFYSTLFAAEPNVSKPDYAKWSLDDPRVNFAISARGRRTGLDHLGIEVESDEELRDAYARLRATKAEVFEEGETTCCYARSEKSWIADPAGVLWETFHTTGESAVYGESVDAAQKIASEGACCAPKNLQTPASAASPCCPK